MPRLMLNDELWSKLREIMLQHKIYNKPNLRRMVEAKLCLDVGDGVFLNLASHVNGATTMLLLALSPKLDDYEEI